MSQAEVEEFFDCKTNTVGNVIYLGMELQFAYQAMTVIQKLDPDLTVEQLGYMQYWD